MSMIGWGDIGKDEGGRGSGIFLSLKDGDAVTFRVIDDGIKKTKFHQVSGDDSSGKDVFRSIMQTEEPDEDYIDQMTNRFPAQTRYAVRVVVYDDDGEAQEIRVLMGGVQIFGAVQKIFQRHGDPRVFDLTLSREGSGRDTEWSVTAAPQSNDLDVEEWTDTMEGDPRLEWDAIFPPITPEQQKQIIEEAGIDIAYDPIASIEEDMTLEQAGKVRISFGKYGPDKMPPKGKTVGQAWKIDQGWVMWVAANATRGDEKVIAACRIMAAQSAIEKGDEAPKKVTGGKQKTHKKAAAPVEPEQDDDDEDDEDEESEVTRDSWSEVGHKSTPEKYLARWFGKGGNEEKLALALAILDSEGLEWAAEERQAIDPNDNPGFTGSVDDIEDEYDPDEMDKNELKEAISEIIVLSDYEPREIVKLVGKFGKGKKRLRDLNEKALRKLLTHLQDE